MTMLRIDRIKLDGGTQTRDEIKANVVEDYADALREEAQFPPVTVFHDGQDYWLADGFHRVHAHRFLNWPEINADVRQGTRRDAVLFSVGANAAHGLRRTNADKRRAVETLLNDSEWAVWSNREIARRCGVDDKTVAALRPAASAEVPQIERKVERGGTTYVQNTARIGQRPVQEGLPEAETPTASTDDTPPFDPSTGELLGAEVAQYMPPQEERAYPPELLTAAQRPMSPAPYQPPTPDEVQDDAQLEELRQLLTRLLACRERVDPAIFDAGFMGLAVRNLLCHTHELLGEWLAGSAQAHDPMTLDAERA